MIYISGPMSGYPGFNYPAFEAAQQELGKDTCISPHNIHHGETDLSYEGYMKRDIQALLMCDEIVMLPGWESSRGAKLERSIAEVLGYKVFESIDEVKRLKAEMGQ